MITINVPKGFIIVCIITNYGEADGCSSSSLLPELLKRSRTYEADGIRGSDPYVDDKYLFPDWYSVTLNNEQYLMPDKNTKPEYKRCGTRHPIYLKDTHPDVGTLTNTPRSVVACEFYPFDSCLNKITIDIRKCGAEVQYYLKGTSSAAAFCFDPPDLQNVTEFSKAPAVKLGTLAVKSELRFKENVSNGEVLLLPFLVFFCQETGGDSREGRTLLYYTYWYIDEKLLFSFESENGLSNLTEDNLQSRRIGLGITVRCGVKIASDITGLKTDLTRSANFFAGIKIIETSVAMSRNEYRTLKFTSTIPYGCYASKNEPKPTEECKIKVHMVVPYDSENCQLSDTNLGGHNIVNYRSHQALCGFEIKGCYPGKLQCSTSTALMNITTRFFSYDDPDTYRFRLMTENAMTHKIWKNYTLGDVVVNIKNDTQFKNKVCFSHVDPHMQTADGKAYENNDSGGEFILYWNRDYNIMIQENTTSCFSKNKRPFCTCAVAVRAGGDIFLINLCNSLKFIGMTSCRDNGALVIQQQSEFDYQVQTNIGTLIKIRIRPHSAYKELMNIDINLAPKDYHSINGLCGTFDSNKDNDFHDRTGKVLNDRLKFIDAWRIKGDDTNFLRPTCNSNVNTWVKDGKQLFCSCDCYGEECKTRRSLKTEATCSSSQYINCTVKLQKTDDLCQIFSHKCLSENRKRRSAFALDPEKEMERKAALAETRKLTRGKRQSNEQNEISLEQVKELCANAVAKSPAVENFSNLLGGYNYTLTIEHCIFDVYESKDIGWIEAQKITLNDAVQIGFKRNANFTVTHEKTLVDFKKQSCPRNCSGNGNCTKEGVCACAKGYFGTDCRHDVKEPPIIEDVEGGGVCDIRYGSECRCFEVQTEVLAEFFHCKRVSKSVDINGTVKTSDVSKVSGKYMNFFTGECCFESHRERRSDPTFIQVMRYEFDVSLSNDGINFGPEVTLHVYDSLCQEFFTDINGLATVRLKAKTCFIDNYCVKDMESNGNEICYRCLPEINRFNWTFDCHMAEDEDRDSLTLYIVIAAVGGSVLVVCVILICIVKIRRNQKARKHVVNVATNMQSLNEKGRESNENTYNTIDDMILDQRQQGPTSGSQGDKIDMVTYELLDSKEMECKELQYIDINVNYEELNKTKLSGSTYKELNF